MAGESSMSLVPSPEEVAAMDKLMSDGKRNYICNQPELALTCFVDLCEKLTTWYGQESVKCVEAYLYYGKTLLDIARLENTVLGPSIKETTDVGSESEPEEEEAQIGSSTSSGKEKAVSSVENGTASEIKKAADTVEDEGDEVGSDAGEDEPEDVSNMELAWEMFELTSVICQRQSNLDTNDKAIKKTLAESKYGLAQISLETERYEEAVNDFTECLKIYEEILDDENDRLLAEAHYNVALALTFDKKYLEAVKEFEKAVAILEARVSNLEKKVKECVESGSKEKAPAELEEWQKEIKELNDLIVLEMKAKIDDALESKKILDESIKTVKNAASEIFGAFGAGSSSSNTGFDTGFDSEYDSGFDKLSTNNSEVVNDCSMKVVSLKRKNETISVSDEKKPKAEVVGNGITSNGL